MTFCSGSFIRPDAILPVFSLDIHGQSFFVLGVKKAMRSAGLVDIRNLGRSIDNCPD
jgi:hypothetical protein